MLCQASNLYLQHGRLLPTAQEFVKCMQSIVLQNLYNWCRSAHG